MLCLADARTLLLDSSLLAQDNCSTASLGLMRCNTHSGCRLSKVVLQRLLYCKDLDPGGYTSRWLLRNMHSTISATLHLTVDTTLKLADAMGKYFMYRGLDNLESAPLTPDYAVS